MSIQALAWVFKYNISPASLKLTLIAFADCASDNMQCWPSVAHVETITNLDRKTIIQNVEKLISLGLLVDSGERKGKTKQIKVYRLNIPNSTANGIVKQSHNTPETVPFFPNKQSQKRDTEPLLTEPLRNHKKKYTDFQKKLMSAGFLSIELNYLVNTEEEARDGIYILHCKTKYAADLIAERCSFKLNAIYPKWKTVIDAAAKPQLEAAQ